MRSLGDGTWYVYTLTDPITLKIRYVGWTINIKRRLSYHMSECLKAKTHRHFWIKGLRDRNLKPTIDIIEEGTGEWQDTERKWIKHYRESGEDLTNLTDGGEGTLGRVYTRGWKMTPEQNRKRIESRGPIVFTGEHKENIRLANIGKKASEEAKQKMSATRIGKRHSEEAKRNMSIAQKGRVRNLSDESRIKMSTSQKNKLPPSEETRRKMSESQLRRYRCKTIMEEDGQICLQI